MDWHVWKIQIHSYNTTTPVASASEGTSYQSINSVIDVARCAQTSRISLQRWRACHAIANTQLCA